MLGATENKVNDRPRRLQFQGQSRAQGHTVPTSAPGLVLSAHGEVEGPLTLPPFWTRVEPDGVSSSRNLSDELKLD